MKTLVTKLMGTALSLRGMTVAALLVAGSARAGQAGSADPSGNGSFTWDLDSNGAGERGIALITFSSDLTFHGYQMLSATPSSSGTNLLTNGRGGTDIGRTGGGGGRSRELLFGFSPVSGTWALDSRGKIVGFLNESLVVTSVITNYFASTNTFTLVNSQLTSETTNVTVSFTNGQPDASVVINWPDPSPGFTQDFVLGNTNFTTSVGSVQTADTVSFTGLAIPGKRLTLICNTPFGRINYRGVPAPDTTSLDISGNWIGNRAENNHQINEFFSLVSVQVDNPFPSDFPDISSFPNLFFTTNGVSEGNTFIGIAMVSQQKTVGFTFKNDDGTLRAMIGSLKPTKFGTTANTKGIEEPLNRVNFKATLQ